MSEQSHVEQGSGQDKSAALQALLSAVANVTSQPARLLLYGATAAVAASIVQADPNLMGLSPTVAGVVTTVNQTVAASPALAALVGAIGGDAVVTILQRVGFRDRPDAEALGRELEQALSADTSAQLQHLGRQLVDDPYFWQQFRSLVAEALAETGVATQRDVYRVERKRQRDDSQRHAELIDALQRILSQLPAAASREPDLDAALALLASLPTDGVPGVGSLPPGSRPGLDPDPHFTGREKELLELAAELKEGNAVTIGQPVAVSGLGGMGKSSLASAFLYRYGRYFAGGVFWLSFADPTNIPSEIADAGSRLDLPGFDGLDLPEKVTATRRAWEGPLPRLLVFDNCEDEALLDKYKPVGGGCRVLVTSRSAAWSPSRDLHMLYLDTLPRPDSIAFLRKLAPRLTEEGADEIAYELGDFPLALHLAGSYLARYKGTTVEAYVASLRQTNPLDNPSLQGRGVKYSPTRHELNVHKTFLLSLERLDPDSHIDSLARDLLLRAACFAPGEPVPVTLLLSTLAVERDEDADHSLDAEDALHRLLEVGLIEPAGEDSVRLHRLLAAFVELLGIDDAIHIAVETAAGTESSRLYQTGLPASYAPLLPHLHYVVGAALRRAGDVHAAWLCNQLATLLDSQGDYAAARPFYEGALLIREQVLGPDHPHTATSLNNFAFVLKVLGDHRAARPLYERALAIRERTLGPEHPDTAASLNNLACLFYEQEDYAAARPLFERALAIAENHLGLDHPHTSTSLNNLAALLFADGDSEGARLLQERSLAIAEKSLHPEHPDIAASLSNLGGLYLTHGDYTSARSLFERALAIYEHTLGPDHRDTAGGLNNLAYLLQAQGDTAAARPLLERALAIAERKLGPDHPDTRLYRKNLELLNSAAE